jgi:hypothetical protein
MTLLAISLLALVSAALVGMSGLFAREVDSARRAGEGAQMRQLLWAGEAVARDRASRWGDRAGGLDEEMELPGALRDGSAGVHVRLVSHSPARVVVEGTWRGRKERRRMRFERVEGRWQVSEVEDVE